MSHPSEWEQSEPSRSKDLDRLIVGYVEDLSTAEELQEFYQRLSEDESARQTFSEQAALHGLLTWLQQQPNLPTGKREQSQLQPTESRSTKSFGKWLPPLMLAASMALVAVSLVISNRSSSNPTNAPSHATAENTTLNGNVVAHIVRKVDCDWEGDRWSIVSASELIPGQTLTLARGLMELKFVSGAMITLEAPVSFTVESAMRGALSHGKLTAQIPESAHGFTIHTPRGEMVDLGTEFGLSVANNGSTETHVFQGEVVVHPEGADDETGELHLTDEMAVRLAGKQDSPNSIAAVPGRFTRLTFEEEDSVNSPVVDRNLQLWYAADHRLQKDEAGRVAAWGDLLTMSNLAEQNAWQVEKAKRPEWIANAIGGQPAVRFGRKHLLITEPVKLDSAQSVAVVFRADLTALKKWKIGEHGRQLLNLNGPPHFTLRINRQLHLVSRYHTGATKSPTGKNPMGKKLYGNVGRTVSPKPLDSKALVAVCVYDPTRNSSRLHLNGTLVAQAKAPRLEATHSPRYIGSHMFLPNTHFFGDLSELMIYNTGLSEEEASSLSRSLMKKYSIESSQPQQADDDEQSQATKDLH